MGLIIHDRREPNLRCCIIEITLKCNFRCIHCGSYAGNLRKNELSKEEIFKLIDDLKKLQCHQITIMGGELFLRNDWYEISKYVTKKDINLVLISNGWFLADKNLVNKIKKLELYTVALSLDGCEKVHDKIRGAPGAFPRVIKAIELLQEADIPVGIITTLNKINIDELQKIKEILYKFRKGIRWQIQTAAYGSKLTKDQLINENDYIHICKFIEESQKEARYDPFELLILGADDIGYNQSCISPYISADRDWNGCKAGIYNLGIQSNGNVKGCLSLSDDFIEGNIRERSIIDIWNDKNSFTFTRNFNKSDLGENCKDCKFGENCKGGCTDVSFSRTGKAANSPLCLYRFEQEGRI